MIICQVPNQGQEVLGSRDVAGQEVYGGGGAGRTSGFCSSVFASAVFFCSLGSFCGHTVHTRIGARQASRMASIYFCTHCVFMICCMQGHCLDAALRGRGALGAARLRVGGWLGIHGGLEQYKLRHKVGWG